MEKWEYARYFLDWNKFEMEISGGKKLKNKEVWVFFNQIGEEGWEMVAATPVSQAAIAAPSGGFTNRILFIFKRRKP